MKVVSAGRGAWCDVRGAESCGGVAGGVGGRVLLLIKGWCLQRITEEAF